MNDDAEIGVDRRPFPAEGTCWRVPRELGERPSPPRRLVGEAPPLHILRIHPSLRSLPSLALALAFFALETVALAQAPDLGEGVELWRGEIRGHGLRLWQIPRATSALIPRRFLLEEVSRPSGTASFLESLDHVEISAAAGLEATRTYSPTTLALHLWGDQLAEVREIFRAPGTYSVRYCLADGTAAVSALVEVTPYAYLSFGREFGFFTFGCGLLGFALYAVYRCLHRRAREPGGPQPLGSQPSLPS